MLFIYLFNSFVRRIEEFFRHWYINSFFVYTHLVVSFLEKLDRFFAVKIIWRYLFHPLYQDRTILGYILGFIFRFWRMIIGGLVYFSIIIIAAVLYLSWLMIPVFVIYKIISSWI